MNMLCDVCDAPVEIGHKCSDHVDITSYLWGHMMLTYKLLNDKANQDNPAMRRRIELTHDYWQCLAARCGYIRRGAYDSDKLVEELTSTCGLQCAKHT